MSEENDFVDFGFIALDTQETIERTRTKERLYNEIEVKNYVQRAIMLFTPLLENLKKSPENETIYWPNRKEKIEKFEQHIENYLTNMFKEE